MSIFSLDFNLVTITAYLNNRVNIILNIIPEEEKTKHFSILNRLEILNK